MPKLNKYKESLLLWILAAAWFVSSLYFWIWWFMPNHIGTQVGFILTSFVLAWPMLLPGYCLFFILKTKKVNQKAQIKSDFRVAMVVTKVPSEPLQLIQKTLKAAISQHYPHDTWVADEDPTEEALQWYRENNVKVSCRKGNSRYDNESWPRRRKCKEGNLAYFYDHYGYDNYDLVVQMDADHIASPNYLENMISPFENKDIGYVAAPSICDSNADNSWAARARLNSEGMFHGPIQSGTNQGWVPVCIGSHYAVRTRALKEIGGIGPELAEDYSTSLAMNAKGWRGFFATEAEAHGDGPNNFGDLIVQDYQWSRSLTMLLLSFFSKHWSKLSLKNKAQFTFTQLWYPLSAFVWLLTITIPIVTLLTGVTPIKVSFQQFALYALIPQVLIFGVFLLVRSKGYLRPKNVKLYSWENALFELARWPWVLLACLDAIIAFVTKEERSIKVTSKNKDEAGVIAIRTIAIYFIIVVVNLFSMALQKNPQNTMGYFWFVFSTTIMYLILILMVVSLHIKENDKQKQSKYFLLSHFRFYVYISLLLIALFAQPTIATIKEQSDQQLTIVQSSDTVKSDLPVENFRRVELIASPGDSKWSLSKTAIKQYLEYKQEKLSDKQINHLTYYMLNYFDDDILLAGQHKIITVDQIEEARQLANL